MGAGWRDAAVGRGYKGDSRLNVLQARKTSCSAVASPNSAPTNPLSVSPSQELCHLIYAVSCDILSYAVTRFSLEADPPGICRNFKEFAC